MNRATKNRINSPIITRVIELNKHLLRITDKAFNLIKRNYLDAVLKKGATLFDYAMRQLKGLDYKKRASELVYEIRSNIYFIAALGGCDAKSCAVADRFCDEILEMLGKLDNVSPGKS